MEDQVYNGRLYDFQFTAAGTNAGCNAGTLAVAGERFVVTSIACSSDTAAVVTIESPSGTTIWKQRFAAAFTLNKDWTHPTVVGPMGSLILVRVSASTSNSEANIGGFARNS